MSTDLRQPVVVERDEEQEPLMWNRRRYHVDVIHSTGVMMMWLTILVWLVMVGLVAIFQPTVFLHVMGGRP